jgi:hypothetical protein
MSKQTAVEWLEKEISEPSYLIGTDLTENQIAILFSEMLL